MTIWLTSKGGNEYWNYAYTIKRFDEYCAAVLKKPASSCVKAYRVK